MKLPWLLSYWVLRYFIPVFAILLTLRIMYIHGMLHGIFALILLCIYLVAWFFSGGVPSGEGTIFVVFLVFYLAWFWFQIFPPTTLREKTRGRQLRPGPGKSKFTSRPSTGKTTFTTRTTHSTDKKGFRS